MNKKVIGTIYLDGKSDPCKFRHYTAYDKHCHRHYGIIVKNI